MINDPYQVLGISPNASEEEIKRAYREQSRKYHPDSPELQSAYTYLASRNYREALQVLSRIGNRTARWYYYSAVANAGMGNGLNALEHARQAVNMEPGNPEYRSLLNQLEAGGNRYQSSRYGGGPVQNYGGQSYGMGNFCCDLWCADTLCECMGGDLCSCF